MTREKLYIKQLTYDTADDEVCEDVIAKVGHAKGYPVIAHSHCYNYLNHNNETITNKHTNWPCQRLSHCHCHNYLCDRNEMIMDNRTNWLVAMTKVIPLSLSQLSLSQQKRKENG